MERVLRAILLDSEATAGPDASSTFGKLREPFLRYMALLRQLNARPESGTIFGALGGLVRFTTGQHVLESPSVFNFYSPAFVPSQAFGAAGLVAPEFQITTANKVIGVSNLTATALFNSPMEVEETLPEVTLDFAPLVDLAEDVDALLDRIDLQFTLRHAAARRTGSHSRGCGARGRSRGSGPPRPLPDPLISPDYAIAQ